MSQLLTYNGYQFNEYSEITVNVMMQDDDSGRTTLYHRMKIRAETTIYAEGAELEGQAGQHFSRIRDRLSKKGQALTIHHKGFAPLFEVNVNATGRQDVAFGPHPRVISWDPVGHENAVHVVWECEVCVSTCSRWAGIMALNYSISTRVDMAGYTTRTISGYIEIAMTRLNQRFLPDTADAYREKIIVAQLPNFQREHHWNLSNDKRRADFTIVDTQIRSPNAFAPGVINITGNHGVGWQRRLSHTLPQTIRATIELAQGQPRSRAWAIFRAIIDSRVAYARASGVTLYFDNLYCDESLFGDTFQFSIGYRTLMQPNLSILTALAGIFSSSGFGQPLNLATWQQWKASIANLQSHRGQAGLAHKANEDQIVDLCSVDFLPITDAPIAANPPMPLAGGSVVNERPQPRNSFLRYDSYMTMEEENPTTVQVPVTEEDAGKAKFDPDKTTAALAPANSNSVVRFVETQAGRMEVVWAGYAERVGYPIARPDKLTIGNIELTRVGRAQFRQKFMGNVLGQPVYAASWNQRYAVAQRPSQMTTAELNEWEV